MSGEPVYKVGNIWWCRIRNPEGGRHIRVSTRCRDRTAAVARWRELERRVMSGSDPRANSPTLAVALGNRLDERKSAGRAAATLDMLQKKARHLTRLIGADTKINRIDARMVDAYVEKRLEEGAARTTVYKELVTLRGALKLARRRNEYVHPLDRVMPEFAARYVPRERVLSLDEIASLLAALPEERSALAGFIIAVAATYPSELKDLRAEDVDLKGGTVRIRGTKTAFRARVVPIVDFARKWIQKAIPFLPFEPWSNVRRDLHMACDAAGIERCSPNDLRRTMLTLLRAKGVEPQLLAAFAGHRDSRMVERVYGRLDVVQLAHLLKERMRGRAGGKKAPTKKRSGDKTSPATH